MLFSKIIQINVIEAAVSVADEMRLLRESVDELQNPQEYLVTIIRNLEEMKDEIPRMKGQINDVLYELNSSVGIDQKLKVAIPIIPAIVSYELGTNVPKLVVDRISDLKKLDEG